VTISNTVRLVGVILIAAAPMMGSAQVALQGTPSPTVTADEESWFQSREPIVFAGNLYYPGGAQTHFNRFEMVRTGSYGSIPLYTRTTLEPFSVIFVPLAGGMMQPYERRRAGELAGTVGSTMPSYPVFSPVDSPISNPVTAVPQAPGPPTGYMVPSAPAPVATLGASVPAQAPTTGSTRPDAARPHGSLTIERPEGLNGIYLMFGDRRWFSDGPAIERSGSDFTKIGEYRGLPVYQKRARGESTIYLPVSSSSDSLVAPFSLRRNR
jgi:hypothetical protein